MMKQMSNSWARRYAVVLSLAVVVTIALARPGFSTAKDTNLAGNNGQNVEEIFNLPSVEGILPQDSIYIYEVVDEFPKFPGGDSALMKFLSENVNYPEAAQKAGAQGRFLTKFVVNADGSIVDVEINKDSKSYVENKELEDEAIRVIKLMPKWTPGKVKGKPVRVRFMLPITFRLN